MHTRIISTATTFIVPQKHNNSYVKIQKRILSRSKRFSRCNLDNLPHNTQKPARKPKKCLKTNLITSHTITQDTKFLFFFLFKNFLFFKNRGVCTTRFRTGGHPLPCHIKNATRQKYAPPLTDRNERHTKPKTNVFGIW